MPNAKDDLEIDFADDGFETEVREALGNPEESLTRGDLKRLDFLASRAQELAEKARELAEWNDLEVVFPDKDLERVVRETLERPVGPLTRGNLKRLEYLDVSAFFSGIDGEEFIRPRTRYQSD